MCEFIDVCACERRRPGARVCVCVCLNARLRTGMDKSCILSHRNASLAGGVNTHTHTVGVNLLSRRTSTERSFLSPSTPPCLFVQPSGFRAQHTRAGPDLRTESICIQKCLPFGYKFECLFLHRIECGHSQSDGCEDTARL